jgi:hypothetical protein
MENMFYVVVIGALLPPLITIFDPEYIYKRFRRRRELAKGPKSKLTQREAHRFIFDISHCLIDDSLFEEPRMDMAFKHASLVKTMLLVAFYAPGIPLALIVAMIGLLLTYWSDKVQFYF